MIHRDKSYGGLDTTCPWPRDSFEWKGLCGHSPLLEGLRPNEPGLGLSLEALERLAAMRKYKVNRKVRDRYYKNVDESRRKARQFRGNNAQRYRDSRLLLERDYCRRNRDRILRRQRDLYRRTKNNPRSRYNLQRIRCRQNVANKTYHCAACNTSCTDKGTLIWHNRTLRHIINTPELGSVESRFHPAFHTVFL